MKRKSEFTVRGTLTLLAAFVVTFFQLGSMKAYGVLAPQLSEHCSLDLWQVGLSGSIWIGVRALLGPMWAALARRFSYRVLTVLGGMISTTGLVCAGLSSTFTQINCSMVLIGLGHGLPLVAKVVALRNYFKVKFSLANGIAFAGGAIGMIMFAPIMKYGIQIYGWRGATFIFGALYLHISVAGCLMVKPKVSIQSYTEITNSSKQKDGKAITDRPNILSRWVQTLCDSMGLSLFMDSPHIVIYLSAFGLHATAVAGWMVFLVSYTISLHFESLQASYLSSIAGMGALVGRIAHAPFVDKGIISGKAMFIIFAVGGALSLACCPLTGEYWILAIISFSTGIFLSAAAPIFIVTLHELFPEDNDQFSSAVGLHYMARGIGRLVGGPLTGWLYDITDEFHPSFFMLAAMEGTAAILSTIIPLKTIMLD